MPNHEDKDVQKMLTTPEVAKMLGFSTQGIRKMCERGKFEGAFQTGTGGQWRIPEPSVRVFLDIARGVRRRRLRREA